MVTPLFSIVAGLLIAFLLGIADRMSRPFARFLTLGTLALFPLVSLSWLLPLITGGISPEATLITTAGFAPPLSIALRMGILESGLTFLVNFAFLVGGFYLLRSFRDRPVAAQVLFLLMAVGANGVIMTRDLFNLFVFLEILSIATYGLLVLDQDGRSLAAGFKYVMAGGIASALFLLGTIYLYRLTGTLNIDDMIASGLPGAELAIPALISLFLVTAALLIELKPFPANGWALDVYEATHPGIAALLSVAGSTAILGALHKLLPLMTERLALLLGVVGFVTFFFSNLVGTKQRAPRRMLGYSSVGQIGLLLAAVVITRELPLSAQALIVGGLLVNHYLAKAGLFWLFGRLGVSDSDSFGRRFGAPVSRALLMLLFLALAGLPPFPGFWAKWELVQLLATGESYLYLVALLFGSLFEAAYLFRWFAHAQAGAGGERPATRVPGSALLFGALLLIAGPATAFLGGFREFWLLAPMVGLLLLSALWFLPGKIKGLLALGVVAFATVRLLYGGFPTTAAITGGFEVTLFSLFGLLLGGGALIMIFGSLYRRGRDTLYFGAITALALALLGLLGAESNLGLFLSWELMTISSYLLLAGGRRSAIQGYRYILFSIGGALAILAGLSILGAQGYELLPSTLLHSGALAAGTVGATGTAAPAIAAWPGGAAGIVAAVLILLGVLTKVGAVGVHLWLPGAYAEAEDDTSGFFSAVFSKAPLVLLITVVAALGIAGAPGAGGAEGAGVAGAGATVAGPAGGALILQLLGWIGAATALFGALLAVFQEDVKHLLAYSSMSQLGYIVLALSMVSHLGWLTALYIAAIHFIFKGMLWLAVAGVFQRTGTRQMHELGGLIKKMPLSFISVLMAIIALSGVPPLAGFGGKWLLYTSLMEQGWYFQAAVAFFASTIAFLYLFKLIYTVFLGQLKDPFREVREASIWLIIPQVLLMAILMAVSTYPNLLLQPLITAIDPILPSSVSWDGYSVISTLGYWNGNAVMWVTMGVFILPLIWLMTIMRRPQRVEQFNMVFSGESPERPETTHFAHNFFAPYQRALGGLVRPGVLRFWAAMSEGVSAGAGAVRRIYTGNGQTYALHILLFVAVLYLILGGAA